MKNLIKKILKEETEGLSQININIPFNKLVIDALNLKWAINNIKQKRPSRSKDNQMQIAVGGDGNYYLLDGYHRLVEYILQGETNTVGVGLNKSFEELKKMDKIAVGCVGGTGDEFCSNFKDTSSIDNIKNEFQKQIKEETEGFLDSTEEDWEWTKDIKPKFHVGDRVRTLDKFTPLGGIISGGDGYYKDYTFTIIGIDAHGDDNDPDVIWPKEPGKHNIGLNGIYDYALELLDS